MINSLAYKFVTLVIFTLFTFALVKYTDGDQVHYRDFYAQISNKNYLQALQFAVIRLQAVEPVTIFILWVGSFSNIDKDIYISFFNLALLLSIHSLLRRTSIHFFIAILLLSNFYVLVLFTGAERLKFGFLFLFLALLYSKRRLLMIIFSIGCHLQIALLIPSYFLYHNYYKIKKLRYSFIVKRKSIIVFFGAFIFFTAMTIYAFPVLFTKIVGYASRYSDIMNILQISFLVLLGVLLTTNKSRLVISLFPLILSALILGESRVNILAWTAICVVLGYENRLNSFILIPVHLYLFIKTLTFYQNIITKGHGF